MILLTGGTGFLGKFIAQELLNSGETVRLLARNPARVKTQGHPQLQVVEGDVLDVESLAVAMEGVEYVIHSAAMVSFWKRQAAEMKAINVSGTANVVDMAREAGVKKLVHVSSVAALGRTTKTAVIDETARWKDGPLNSRYAKSKYLAELEVVRGVEEGLAAVICNPGFILGPGEWNAGTPRVFDQIYHGLRFYPRGYSGIVAVQDVARATVQLMRSRFENAERFLLVGENMYYKDLFAMIAKELGVKAPRISVNKFIAFFGAFAAGIKSKIDGKEPLLTRETATTSANHYTYVNEKVKRELNFTFTPISDTVRETAQIYLKEHGHHR